MPTETMCRPLHLCRTAAVVAAFVGTSAHADEAARPQVAVGDSWHFVVYYTVPSTTPNRTWTVTSIGPDKILGTENGEPLTLTRDLNVADSPRQSESNPRQLSFPLRVGKRWQYHSEWLFKPKSSRGTIAMSVVVVGHETVEVPAGRFDAFRLQATGELGGASPSNTFYAGQTTTTYWYAPAAKAVVKSVHHNPYQGTTTVELVRFQLRP
ncbi:MAG: hypothetical protein KIT60_09100 [Burkholderiaceae bacterium]|nr:hypothetical protein [Burkholderiaceae bacterium]